MAVTIPIISEFDGKGVEKAVKQFKQLETTGQKPKLRSKRLLCQPRPRLLV